MSKNKEKLDIIKLVEGNPLTKLGKLDYGILVNKIKEKFNTDEEHLFVGNFYMYLNYDTKKDFVIIFDGVWKWLGYSRNDPCKATLVKNFIENKDYKIENFAPEMSGAKNDVEYIKKIETRGGLELLCV